MSEWRMFCEPNLLGNSQELTILRFKGDDAMSVVTGLVLADVDPRMRLDPKRPSLLEGDARPFLQAAMDAAYEIGLRPSRAQDERHLERHLQDMRALAFKVIGADKP
jgi:hypothetical protein